MADGVVIKIDGDASGLQKALADTPKVVEQALSGVAQGAAGASQALDGVARSSTSMLDALGGGMGAGVDKLIDLAGKAELANEKLAALKTRAEETGAALSKAQTAAQTQATILGEIQESAAITAELLKEANEALQDKSDMGAWLQATRDVSELGHEMEQLDAEIAQQKTIVEQADASVQKYAERYAALNEQLVAAENAAATASGAFEAAAQEVATAAEQALSGVSQLASDASQALDDVGKSGASAFDSLSGGGDGVDKLIALAEEADLANQQLEELKAQVAETGAALSAVQAPADEFARAREDVARYGSELEKLNSKITNLELRLGEGPASISFLESTPEIVEMREELAALTSKADETAVKFEAARAVVNRYSAMQRKAKEETERLTAAQAKLTEQLAAAEIAATTANEKFEVMAQSIAVTADDSLGGFDDATAKSMRSTGVFTGILEDLAGGAFTEVSNSAMKAVRGMDGFGGSTLAMSAAARGLQAVLRGLVGGGAGWLALAAAMGAATYKLYDVVSGAAAAREAIEGLKETADSWEKTNVKTGFEDSKGLSAFGLSSDDFSASIQATRNWRDEVVRVWSDGKKESNEIVKEMVGGFTSESDTVRKKLAEIKETAGRGGFAGDGFLAGLDTDIDRLGQIDKEVEKLLKKKQNGLLSEKDQAKLAGLYDERQAIVIKYKLEPESNTGFDRIVQDVDAALSRGADPAQTFTDAYAAATEGMGAFTAALNAEYDAQYAALEMSGQLFEENGEKTTAFLALQAWYNEQATKGVDDYNKALQDVSEKTDAFGDDGKYAETAEKLEKIQELMRDAAGGKNKEATADLADALSELDETQIVEVTTALTSMQAAAEQAGVPLAENAQKMLDLLGYIKGTVGGENNFDTGLQEALDKMFGAGLDGEVLEVYAALNAESLEATYAAWAQGEHADIIPTIETDSLKNMLDSWAGDYKLGVNGELQKVDPHTGELEDTGYRMGVDGKVRKVNPHTGVLEDTNYRIDVNGRLQKIDDTSEASLDDAYRIGVGGYIEALDPYTGDTKTTKYRVGINGEIEELDPYTGDTMTTNYRVGVGGEIEELDPYTGDTKDAKYRVNLDGKIVEVDPSSAKLTDTEYKFAVDGEIIHLVESPNATKPTIMLDGEVMVRKVNFEEGQFSNSTNPEIEYLAAKANVNQGSQSWITSSEAENMTSMAKAIAEYNEAVAKGDTDAQMGMAQSLQWLGDTLGTQLNMGGFEDAAKNITNGLQLLAEGKLAPEDAQALLEYIDAVTTIIDSGMALGSTMGGEELAQGISDALTAYGWDSTAQTVSSQLVAALDAAKSKARSSGENFGQGYVDGVLAKEAAARAAGGRLGTAAAEGLRAAQQEQSPAKVPRKSGSNFGLGYVGGIIDRVKDAQAAGQKLAYAGVAGLNVGSLHTAALMSGSVANRAVPEPIDYDRLADAVAQRPANLYAKGRMMATTLAADNARAINARQKRIAQGYGGR